MASSEDVSDTNSGSSQMMSSIGKKTPGIILSKSPSCSGSGEEMTSRSMVTVLSKVKGSSMSHFQRYSYQG